ncbi:MAG: type VI secretion system baseplate subunit TssE [Deltaproteobacteria bacterium]|nr:type VI secretion system baseplate subunit TssE [Deltaproteobacteria bacterium]
MALFSKFERTNIGNSELTSILRNLNNILNTKRNFGSPLPDYGIRDLSEYKSRDEIALAVIHEVRGNIARYEHRVALDEIVFNDEGDTLRLSFTIRCHLLHSSRSLRMLFDTVFNTVSIDDRA